MTRVKVVLSDGFIIIVTVDYPFTNDEIQKFLEKHFISFEDWERV